MQDSTKFLFIGDSITDGAWARNCDPNHILGHGFVFYAAATLSVEYAPQRPKFYNRGVSGQSSWLIRKRWQEDALDIAPDVLTILCGVNDTLRKTPVEPPVNADQEELDHCDVAGYEENLRYMIESSRAQNPDLKLILGVPFYYVVEDFDTRFSSEGDKKEQRFTRQIRNIFQKNSERRLSEIAERQAVVRRLAGEYGAVLLDIPALFEKAFSLAPRSYWTWDGVHPTFPMHGMIAQEWLNLYRLNFA
ncbi:MAG: lysophospholipase [Lentisphaeria bacterium]|nr:lysophospholipase [Lentisphaeria bacterium]